MEIVTASENDAQLLAGIISHGNRDVAKDFGLTKENAAKHPSFCTAEWIKQDFQNGQIYFLAMESGTAIGCVAFQQPDAQTAYLNRLSVLPDFRHRGTGARLVRHIIDYSKQRQILYISIGIIAENTRLKQWYRGLGFKDAETLQFDHLPFDVMIMKYNV